MIHSFFANLQRRPDRQRSLHEYGKLAKGYDSTTTRIVRIRDDAIGSLNLKPGQSVLDIACGTGETIVRLAELVAPGGQVVGVDQSPQMAELAERRVRDIPHEAMLRVIVSPIELLELPDRFDAILLSFTSDVLLNPEAVNRIALHAKPGARIAVAGLRFLPWWWAAPINAFNAYRARKYLTSFRGLHEPWRALLGVAADLVVEQTYLLGSCYRAVGTITLSSDSANRGDGHE